MLTESQLDEGSSTSMGSREESDTPRTTNSGDEASYDGDKEDWGVVTEGEAGVLILEGEELDTPKLLTEGDQLSVPGTDSLPSVLGSIDALPQEAQKDDDGVEKAEEAKKEEAKPPSDFQENRPNAPPAPVPSGVLGQKALLLLSVSSSLLFGVTTIGLVHYRGENQHLQEQVNLLDSKRMFLEDRTSELLGQLTPLEEEIVLLRPLEKEVKDLREINKSIYSLERELHQLKEENERMKQEEQLRLDDYEKEGFVLIDNCWVKADVQLGNCASDAKEYVKDAFYASLFYQLFNASNLHSFEEEPVEDEYEVTVNKIMNMMDSLGKDVGSRMDSFGKSLWKSFEATSAESDSKLNEFFSRMDERAQAWFKESLGQSVENQNNGQTFDEGIPSSGGLDDIVKGFSQMLGAGDAVVSKTIEAMGLNETEVLIAVEEMFRDASYSQHSATDEK